MTVSKQSIKASTVIGKPSKAGDGVGGWVLAASRAELGSNPDFSTHREGWVRSVISFLSLFPCLNEDMRPTCRTVERTHVCLVNGNC